MNELCNEDLSGWDLFDTLVSEIATRLNISELEVIRIACEQFEKRESRLPEPQRDIGEPECEIGFTDTVIHYE